MAVPDLPGCFSAGDTLDEALSNAEEAVAAWIDAVLDAGGAVPRPTDIQRIQLLPGFEGWAFGFIEVDPELLADTSEHVAVVLSRRVVKRLHLLETAAESREE